MRLTRGLIGSLVALVALWSIARRAVDIVEVRGRSMAPALLPGDRLVAVRLNRPPRVGDVVLAPDPRNADRELVKRVAQVDVSGAVLRGDNPAISTDARTFGVIPADRIGWRVVARVWPMVRAGRLARPPRLHLAEEGGEVACTAPEDLVAG